MTSFSKMNKQVSSEYDDVVYYSYDDVIHEQLNSIISEEVKIIFEAIFFSAFCGLASLIGITANMINIVIFCKQGFNNTVNIAFCGLAISDLWCLIFLVWASICMNPLLSVYGVPWVGIEVMYVTAAWPHICFCRITSYITVYITGERCLSIAFPLKIKQIVTKTKTVVIISLIYFVNLLTVVPECSTSNLGWRFIPGKNMTLLAVIFTSSRKSVEGICFVIHSLISTTSFFGVILFTIILVIKLKQNSKLRKELTSGGENTRSMSTRDKKAVKMIVLIACILIACYIPGAMIAMATFVVGPDFMIQGRYIDICSAVWSIACSCQSINSSVNILLYYKMSSKYKQIFNELFKCFGHNEKL